MLIYCWIKLQNNKINSISNNMNLKMQTQKKLMKQNKRILKLALLHFKIIQDYYIQKEKLVLIEKKFILKSKSNFLSI